MKEGKQREDRPPNSCREGTRKNGGEQLIENDKAVRKVATHPSSTTWTDGPRLHIWQNADETGKEKSAPAEREHVLSTAMRLTVLVTKKYRRECKSDVSLTSVRSCFCFSAN